MIIDIFDLIFMFVIPGQSEIGNRWSNLKRYSKTIASSLLNGGFLLVKTLE
jgi:hypothetical protein